MRTPSTVILAALLTAVGCDQGTLLDTDVDSEPDTDTSTDTDADTDSDTDADTDSDTDADTDSDTTTGELSCGDPLPQVVGGCVQPVWLLNYEGNCNGLVECADGSINRMAAAPAIINNSNLCTTDADCGEDQACLVEIGSEDWMDAQCVPASCNTGVDCASGECGVGVHFDGCSLWGALACRTADDDCRIDEQGEFGLMECSVGWTGEFELRFQDCAVGRPLRVDGTNQMAGIAHTDSWCDHVDSSDASSQHAQTLAAHWAGIAAMEHASVASFNRVSLQLMALGAPAELVRRTSEAALDEIRHAEQTFALASRFAGRALGPGPLDLSGLTLDTSPEAVLKDLIEEACIRETLGVAEALLAAEQCTDLQTRRTLKTIADDELRHAQLAWSTLTWLLEAHPSLRPAAHALLNEALAEAATGDLASAGASLPSMGLPALADKRATHRAVVETSLRPVVDALFSERLAA